MDFNSLEGKNKINKIVEETLAHQSQCYESSFQAKGSKVNSDNKDEIGERHLGIAQQSQPLVQAITQLKQHSNMLENIQITVPHLKQIREIISTISLRLFPPGGPTNDQLTFCENQLAALEKHVKELKQMRNHAALADQIAIQTRIVATILIDLRKMAKTSLFCTAQLQPGSLLEQIANEKKQSLGSTSESASLKNKLTLFKQEILNAFDDVYRPQLLSKLRTIEDTKLAQQVDTALQEFMGICRQAMPQTTPSIDTHRSNYYQAHQQILTAIDHTHLFEPNQNETAIKGIRDSIALAQQHLQALETWEEKHIQQVPYINFSTVDMKGLQDWASGLVCDRIQERLDGFMGFLKREETYRYGLLNHMFLVPYVQASRDGK